MSGGSPSRRGLLVGLVALLAACGSGERGDALRALRVLGASGGSLAARPPSAGPAELERQRREEARRGELKSHGGWLLTPTELAVLHAQP